MNTEVFSTTEFVAHLLSYSRPLAVRNRPDGVVWADEPLHRAAFEHDPEFYALLALVDGVSAERRAGMLYLMLARSWVGLTVEQRATLRRVVALLLPALPADDVLTVFLTLRRARANHKHAARAIVRYIVNHPQLADLLARRRPAVAAALEHALGKNVARGAVRMLREPQEGGAEYARRHLLRFAREPERARRLLPALYEHGAGDLALDALESGYMQAHLRGAVLLDRQVEPPKTVTNTNRGDIAATLVHLYHGGSSAALEDALRDYVEFFAATLPHFAGSVALVLDTSASMRGHGEREFAQISQAVALRLVLERVSADFRLFATDAESLPQPRGATDLAGPLLDALATAPDLALIVSDGYENVYNGDLARVAASLVGAGVRTPVAFCRGNFSPADDVSFRRPAGSLPQFEFWHQDDFERLLLRLFVLAGAQGVVGVREFLFAKLDRAEKELASWTTVD